MVNGQPDVRFYCRAFAVSTFNTGKAGATIHAYYVNNVIDSNIYWPSRGPSKIDDPAKAWALWRFLPSYGRENLSYMRFILRR
jgi:hypothetical protein